MIQTEKTDFELMAYLKLMVGVTMLDRLQTLGVSSHLSQEIVASQQHNVVRLWDYALDQHEMHRLGSQSAQHAVPFCSALKPFKIYHVHYYLA